jgi:membrane-bound lytic murein transglycosylase B
MRRLLTSRARAATLAVVLLAVAGVTTAADAQQASPPPSVETPASLAKQTFELTQKAVDLEGKLPKLQADLAAVDALVTKVGGGVADERRLASELLVAAKRQAIETYLRGDSQSQTVAIANAISQKNSNDAAWSLGVLQVTNRKTIDLMQAARVRGVNASKELTDALTARERAKAAIAQVERDAKTLRRAATAVGVRIEALVVAQAPVTIGTMTTVAYEAYRRAAGALASERPSCGLRWELLAAIGKTESDHGAGRLDSTGVTKPPIIGIPTGRDTDGGKYDLDASKDHAVGPMQFIPSTWISYLSDGNGDGISDINNIYDESLAAARYLCVAAGSLTLTTKEGVTRAILAYNPNQEYLRTVGGRFEALAQDVARGWFSAADLPQAPPPVPGVAPGGATGGAVPPTVPPTVTPTGNTELRKVTLFGASSVIVPTVSTTPIEGTCAAPTRRLAPRVGALTCTSGATVFDPCLVAPYDRTQVVCFDDPEKAATLVHVAAALPPTPLEVAPPYFALVLQGNDRCLPVAPPGAARSAQTASSNSTSSSSTSAPVNSSSSSSSSVAPSSSTSSSSTSSSSTSSSSTPSSSGATTSSSTPDVSSTSSTSTAASSSSSSVPATSAPAATTPSTTALPPTPADATTYRCSSGADIVGQPVVTSSFWTVTVRQTGIANRNVPVTLAFG